MTNDQVRQVINYIKKTGRIGLSSAAAGIEETEVKKHMSNNPQFFSLVRRAQLVYQMDVGVEMDLNLFLNEVRYTCP